MAVTLSRAAATQLTASGTSTTMDGDGKLGKACYLKHSNGSGTVSAAATFDVQMQTKGGSEWYTQTNGPTPFGTTAAATETRTIPVPDSAASVRVVYVAPTGPTGYTLDAECGLVSF